MGIIEKLIDSSDDQVRKAEVRMIIRDKNIEKNKSLKTVIRTKAVFQLYPLELKVRQDFFYIQEEQRDQEDQELIELSEEIIDSGEQGTIEELNIEQNQERSGNNTEIEYLEENEWQECKWKECKKPRDKILKWIECERCKEWLHVICVELKEIDLDAIFACPQCWEPKIQDTKWEEDEELDFSGFETQIEEEKIENRRSKRNKKTTKKEEYSYDMY